MKQNRPPEDGWSNTVENAFRILEYLKEEDGARLSELAGEFDKAKSTIHRYVITLNHLGYTVEEAGIHYPSLKFLDYSEYSQNRKEGYILAKTKVENLARETEERAQFLVEEHGKGVYLHRATGSRAARTDPGIGKEVPLHAAAAGKAILSQLPRKKVEAIIDRHGLPAVTEHTITDPEELFANLNEIQERGYSFNLQENVDGLNAVGVPVRDKDDSVLGALSISGPTHRLKRSWFKEELPDQLLGTANELELNIAHS